MDVLPATVADLGQIVDIHLASFKGFFLSSLGPRFLRILYQRMMDADVGILLVCREHGTIQGFVGGVLEQEGFYGCLVRRYKWHFAMASLSAVLRRPSIAPRLLRALRKPADTSESMAKACLMSIGVAPAAEGKGIGRALVIAFCEELRRRQCPSVCLTTDKLGNDRVNRFYQGLGFALARQYTTAEGRAMNEYLKMLS